jgi:peptidoglycan/LPS O-acetylase OafA/YrhL
MSKLDPIEAKLQIESFSTRIEKMGITAFGIAEEPAAPRTELQSSDKRLDALQGLRAIGALLVVFAHSIDTAEKSLGTPIQAHFFYWENFGASGLDIFFAISGFIVSLVAIRAANGRNETTSFASRKFLSKRITRIYPLYWILTVVVLFLGIMDHLRNLPLWFSVAWHSFLAPKTLLLLPPWTYPAHFPVLSLGWSLIFEMYFYFVLAVFIYLTPRHLVRNAMGFICAMVGLGLITGLKYPVLVIYMNPLALEFAFGCLICLLFVHFSDRRASLRRIGQGFALLGAGLMVTTIFTGYGAISEMYPILAGRNCWMRVGVWGIPAALLVGGVVFWAPSMRSLPGRISVFLGDASYSIYLCTIPLQMIQLHTLKYFPKLPADAGVLLSVICTVGTGVACYLLLERPMMRFFHNWHKSIPFHITTA